jgi:molybdenum cofactor synthesis domain-containing protein
MSCNDSYVAPGVLDALNTLDHAYRLYGPKSVICSFNGGKDAVVILHLVLAAHAHYYSAYCQHDDGSAPLFIVRPRVVYFDHEDEFPAIIDFLKENVHELDLDMIAFEKGIKFTEGLRILVENNRPGLDHRWSDDISSRQQQMTFPMAFVLGTRLTDPNAGSQGAFAPSSHFMPPFMRVNPILNWTYGHVWHFLRLFHLPYCRLYDQGYTSLGTTKDTVPCPALSVPGVSSETGVPKYWPAYMLRDYDQERAGRIAKEAAHHSTAKQKDKPQDSCSPNGDLEQSLSSKSHLSTFSDLRYSMPRTFTANFIGRRVSAPAILTNTGTETSLHAQDDTMSMESSSDDGKVNQNEDNQNADVVSVKTVGILIIGDEILKGQTADVNTQAAALALRKESVLLRRVVVVPDEQEVIVEEIRRMRHQVDVLITSGGVGPTHDDVTIKSVAVALGQDMVLHEEMKQLLQEKMKGRNNSSSTSGNGDSEEEQERLSEALLKMATLPANAKLRYFSDNIKDWPVLQCRNIFILPGIPELFAKKIGNLAGYLSSQLERSVAYKIVLSVDEAAIVDVLNTAVKRHPDVAFGSYPFVSQPEFKTVLTLEGRLIRQVDEDGVGDDENENLKHDKRNSVIWSRRNLSPNQVFTKEEMDNNVRMALDELINDLPEGSILRVDNDDLTPFS